MPYGIPVDEPRRCRVALQYSRRRTVTFSEEIFMKPRVQRDVVAPSQIAIEAVVSVRIHRGCPKRRGTTDPTDPSAGASGDVPQMSKQIPHMQEPLGQSQLAPWSNAHFSLVHFDLIIASHPRRVRGPVLTIPQAALLFSTRDTATLVRRSAH